MITKPDYCKIAEIYDASFESGAEVISYSNSTLEKILSSYHVKTVLDLTCGTGLQALWLAKHGYQVVGADISPGMLKIARRKAKKEKLTITFLHGDMCSIKVGKFDAVITIFNAIGHLTKTNFTKALRNIRHNLNDSGIYLFDIFNAGMNQALETSLNVDATTTLDGISVRKIQTCKINKENGIMTVYEEQHTQAEQRKPKITKSKSTLQTYTAQWLQNILKDNGFNVLAQYGPNGTSFSAEDSLSILTVAQKSKKT